METGDCSAWRLQSFFASKNKGTRNKYRLSVGYGVDSKHSKRVPVCEKCLLG